MKIVVDENVPAAESLFSFFGDVELLSGRSLSASQVKNADILIVRSVTQVNRDLLCGSKVQFVGTCTIGVDHLDQKYLNQSGITYVNAPGCNADGVVQYDLAALSHLDDAWMQKTVGIIGCGNVGRRLFHSMNVLGVPCRVYDPFLYDPDVPLCQLEEVLNSPIVCMHAPYTTDGPFPTRHMVNSSNLPCLPEGAILLNAGRGGTVDNQALLNHVKSDADLKLVLDVWEGEPDIMLELLPYTRLASAHIAGYGYEGKLNGSSMIFEALVQYLAASSSKNINEDEALTHMETVMSALKGEHSDLPCQTITQAIEASYDIVADDTRFRQMMSDAQQNPAGSHIQAFDKYRKTYPTRREFSHYNVVTNEINLKQLAGRLGFGNGDCALALD